MAGWEASGVATHTGYMPALDGMRAVAVVAVLLYHGDVSWASGGYLGVDAFFVLSGFLITTLLLAEWDRSGTIALGAFWSRRARRLLPALGLVLAAVVAYAAFAAHPTELRALRQDTLSALAYLANWGQVLSDRSYFEQFAAPSPLRHMWSLAIEEQFYLVWPLVVLGVLRARRGSTRALGVACGTLAAGSIALMALLYTPGTDPSRVYYGTDTRLQSLAIGALLACVLARRPVVSGRAARRVLHTAAAVSAVTLLALWATASSRDAWQYRGGFAFLALLVATVITAVTHCSDRGPVGAVLSWRPLRAIGTISYGLYLWHWPVYVLLDPVRTGLDGPSLLALRIAVTSGVSVLSFRLVERPVRYGAGRGWSVRVATPAFAGAIAAAIVLATAATVPAAFDDSVTAADLRPPAPRPVAARSAVVGSGALAAEVAVAAAVVEPPRVMLVGDSMAASLGPGLERASTERAFLFWNAAVPGCGLASDVGERWFDEWRDPDPRCAPAWRDRWPLQVADFDPDVVVVLVGAQDAFDRRIDGRVVPFDSAEGDALARADLTGAFDTLSATGARVVVLSMPYNELGWPMQIDHERSAFNDAWVNRYNMIERSAADAHPAGIRVLDLNRLLGPDHTWTPTVDGVEVRSFDRSHLSDAGADYVADWLVPLILPLAEDDPTPSVRLVRR